MVATSASAWATMTSLSVIEPGFGPEQVECADHLPAQAHWDGVGGLEPGGDGDGSETGPRGVAKG